MRFAMIFTLLVMTVAARSAEEKIRGILEKTTKAGACAQITDALSDVYYITKTDESEKAVANFVGKNQKVVITGTVEAKEGDLSLFFNLKGAEAYTPKMPPAPPAPAAPPADNKTGETKPDAKPAEVKPADAKPDEKK